MSYVAAGDRPGVGAGPRDHLERARWPGMRPGSGPGNSSDQPWNMCAMARSAPVCWAKASERLGPPAGRLPVRLDPGTQPRTLVGQLRTPAGRLVRPGRPRLHRRGTAGVGGEQGRRLVAAAREGERRRHQHRHDTPCGLHRSNLRSSSVDDMLPERRGQPASTPGAAPAAQRAQRVQLQHPPQPPGGGRRTRRPRRPPRPAAPTGRGRTPPGPAAAVRRSSPPPAPRRSACPGRTGAAPSPSATGSAARCY